MNPSQQYTTPFDGHNSSEERFDDDQMKKLNKAWKEMKKTLPKNQRKLIHAYVQYKSEKIARKVVEEFMKEHEIKKESFPEENVAKHNSFEEEKLQQDKKQKKWQKKMKRLEEKRMKHMRQCGYPMAWQRHYPQQFPAAPMFQPINYAQPPPPPMCFAQPTPQFYAPPQFYPPPQFCPPCMPMKKNHMHRHCPPPPPGMNQCFRPQPPTYFQPPFPTK